MRLIGPLPSPRRGTGPTWAGPLLAAVGVALLAGWAATLVLGEWRQAQADAIWQRLSGRGVAHERHGEAPPPPGMARPVDGVDFLLRVPKLGYRATVREGVTADVLFGGPGHYPDSHWPGQLGTIGVAAHNVYWMRFDQIEPGDELALDTRYGTFHYRVSATRVVGPDDRSVLLDGPGPRLVLTTCWPLWAGQFATRRLAVVAG
jgi:LPXTG-site transpeptidase (sortase) family protein